MLYSRAFLIMALANMFTMASISSFFLLPLYITHHGGTEADIGILMAVFTFSSILSRPWISEMIDRIGRKRTYTIACILMRLFGGRLADKVGEERIIPNGFAITGCWILSIIFLNGNAVLMLSGFLAGSGHGLLYPSLNAFAIRNEPADIRGKVIGIFTGGLDAGIFVGSIILGYTGKWFGFQTLFFIAGLPLFIGLFLVSISMA